MNTKEQEYEYVLKCLNVEGESVKEQLTNLFKRFREEYQYRDKAVAPCFLARWLQGLPSCISIDFADYDIIQLGKAWGHIRTKLDEEYFVYHWFDRIARRLIELTRMYEVVR